MNDRDGTALLIGYGSIGQKRCRILRDFGWLVTVMESSGDRRLQAFADGFKDVWSAFPITWSGSVAFVCSPPKNHAEHAIACLEAGHHVFIEKPLAHTLADARRICDVANNRHVMVGCNYRFGNKLIMPRDAIRSLDIALEYDLAAARPNWRDTYVNDPVQGGIVLDSGVHAIDLARVMVGPIKLVYGYSVPSSLGGLYDNTAEITLLHANGILSRLHLSWTASKPVRKLVCETKTGQPWHLELWDGTDTMFECEMRAFLQAVKDDNQPPNGPEEAIETLRWCLAARKLVRKGSCSE